jgi:hypothetical protein
MTQARGVQARLLRFENAESAYKTDPSSSHSIKLPINTCEIGPDRNLITPATITGRADAVAPAQGFTDVRGAVRVPVDQCAMGYWLQALLGAPTSTGVGSAYQHVFKVNSIQSSFAYEKGFTDIAAYEKLTGVKVDGMSLTVGGDEELTASFDLIGADAAPAGTSMSTRITTLSLSRFNQFDASMSEGGSVFGKARNFTLNVRRNLDAGVYLVTSGSTGKRGDLPAGFCNVNGTFDMLFENNSYYIKAQSGSETSLNLRFQTGSFYLLFEINEAVYRWMGPPINTPVGIWLPMAFEGYFDNASPDDTIIQATLVNTWAAYSGHL